MTTTYKIIDLTVVQTIAHADGSISSNYHGPYKNEESAKRRIRDLKRKDNEVAATNIGDTVKPEMIVPIAAKSELAPVDQLARPRIGPNVDKLAMSSEYGKSKPFTVTPAVASMNNYVPLRTYGAIGTPSFDTDERRIARQVGCYPAISKHAYQR